MKMTRKDFKNMLGDCVKNVLVQMNESPMAATRRASTKDIEDNADYLPIPFEDNLVYNLFKDWNKGEPLTFQQAREMTELPKIFKKTDISSFNELKYFTSLTSIGNGAFIGCYNLTSINIPNNVTSIERDAFVSCTGLTSINIPDSITSIGKGAFHNCENLTSINIPNSVTTIGTWAFYNCCSLTNIVISNSVTTIGDRTFSYCTSLTSIDIPNSVTSIGMGAFCECESLTNINIPNSVTTIGDNAFYDCTSLTNINIPNSVTTIGDNAFYDCTSLTSIILPERFKDKKNRLRIPLRTKIEYRPDILTEHNEHSIHRTKSSDFNFDTQVRAIFTTSTHFHNQLCSYLDEENIKYIQNDNTLMLFDTNIIPSMSYRSVGIETIKLFNGIEIVDDSAFWGCSALKKVELSSTVQTLKRCAFCLCQELEELIIPTNSKLQTIEDSVFYKCSKMKSFILPETLKEIKNSAFFWCKNFKSIIIPDNLAVINAAAFKSSGIHKFIYKGKTYYSQKQFLTAFSNSKNTAILESNQSNTLSTSEKDFEKESDAYLNGMWSGNLREKISDFYGDSFDTEEFEYIMKEYNCSVQWEFDDVYEDLGDNGQIYLQCCSVTDIQGVTRTFEFYYNNLTNKITEIKFLSYQK